MDFKRRNTLFFIPFLFCLFLRNVENIERNNVKSGSNYKPDTLHVKNITKPNEVESQVRRIEKSSDSERNTSKEIYHNIENKVLVKREINQTDYMLNDTDISDDDWNSTQNCTNDYCTSDEEYIDMIEGYMYPRSYEWVLIALHSVVFLVGLVGNALVCVAVYRNHSMRTVTNYFIVNLAVADFMVILFCLPPTVLWDVTETWFFGKAMCKIVLYIQTVSVTVSVLTLTFISIDRWYAICYPLRFNSTTGRAKTAIIIIWLIALVFDIPELVVLTTVQTLNNPDLVYFIQCNASWSQDSESTWMVLKMVLLYAFPLAFMSVAYCQIVRVLWHSDNIQGHMEFNSGPVGCGNRRSNTFTMNSNASTEGQLRSRRKAAKMLVAVVFMFAVCYFPVHLFSVMRLTMNLPQTDVYSALALVFHWMCYANSAINPVIYNFMSGKFRREFRRAFAQCCHSSNRRTNYQLNSLSSNNGLPARDFVHASTYRRPHEIRQQNIYTEPKTNARI